MNLLAEYPFVTLKDLARSFLVYNAFRGIKSVSFSDQAFIDYVEDAMSFDAEGEDACSEVAWERRCHDRAVEQDMRDGSYWIERDAWAREDAMREGGVAVHCLGLGDLMGRI